MKDYIQALSLLSDGERSAIEIYNALPDVQGKEAAMDETPADLVNALALLRQASPSFLEEVKEAIR